MEHRGTKNPDRREALAFAASFRRFLEGVHTPDAGVGHGNPVAALVAEILGEHGRAESVVNRELPPFEHVNLQTAADADLLFLLSTNRADLLEPALAARPGRVDVAVEVGLPDPEARTRLFELDARRTPMRLTDVEVQEVVERSDGVTASFLKELVRRAVLESLREDGSLQQVTIDHIRRGLDDLLDTAQGVTRSLLGMGAEPTPGSGIDAVPGLAPPGGGSGWVAFSPRQGGRRHR